MFTWTGCASAQINSNTRIAREDTPQGVFHTGRNMAFYGQLALRSFDDFEITDITVNCDKNVNFTFNIAENVVFNDGVPYPDKVTNKTSVKVLSHFTQTIWVTGEVAKNAAIGSKKYDITVKTTQGDFVFPWTVVIHKATLKKPAESDFGHEYFFDSLRYFEYKDTPYTKPNFDFYKYKRYSSGWWRLNAHFAEKMKAMRVNSVNIPLINLLADSGSRRVNDNKWEFDFTLADKFIETFLKYGSFKYISINAVIASCDGKKIHAIDENSNVTMLEIFTEEAEAWATQFYTVIYKHFCEKGWKELLLMRLEDEPHSTEYWIWARELCKKCMPGIACGEPLDTDGIPEGLVGHINQYIPRVNVYAKDIAFFEERQAAGDEVWVYSCCYPEEPWWLNKFIDLPHSFSRIMEWACFSHSVTGFLHWGYMFWESQLYGLCPESRFKGDAYIVYPDVENSDLLYSARSFETASGVVDWELLNMLKQYSPESATGISKRIATGFDAFNYDASGRNLEAARAEVLTALDSYI